MKKIFFQSLLVIFSFISFQAFSVQVSQAQIEQFKKLPLAQQKQLAKQMGVDISAFIPQGASSNATNSQPAQLSAPVQREEKPEVEDEFLALNSSQKKLQPFGYDIFNNAPSTFNPVSNIAIPASYIVGVGDVISLQIFGKENDQYTLEVMREGHVIVPNLGPFQVAGLSFEEMKRFLTAQIKERIIGVDAVVSLAQLKSIRVFVLGDAYKPGPYTISSLSSITHALFTAGGVSDIGSLRHIQLKRAGKLVQSFDFYDLLINGDSSKDLLLQNGDVVFVATKGATVSVAGEVRRPAIYEIKQNESFADVIAMAGGVLPSAYQQQVSVERFNNTLRSVVNLNLTDKRQTKQKVQDGDYIEVMEKSHMYDQSLTLIGAVTRPGKYQWQQGMKITDVIQNIDTDLLAHADLNYSLLVREVDLAKNIEVHQFSLAQAFSSSESRDNLTLTPSDKLVIFSRSESVLDEQISLENLAYTQEDLLLKNRQQAKEKHQADAFWEKYGKGKSQQEVIDVDQSQQAFTESVTQLANGDLAKRKVQKSLFSRQKLLAPINNQLIQQSHAGQTFQLVEIDGQVKYPGTYPLPVNGKVKDLVIAAGGVVESAYLKRVNLTRTVIENAEAKKQHIDVNLYNALKNNDTDNIALQSKDRINIHKIPAWSENQTIELKGEFVFPGRYSFQRGETLAQLIERAGGLTSFAHLEGSIFTRKRLQDLEQENIEKITGDLRLELASKSLSKDATVSYNEAQQLIKDLANIEPVGRLVIDLNKVLELADYDIMLEGGDILYIPALKNSVNVIGQVQVTSSHVFERELDVFDYIKLSGGIKKRADDERIYIVSANGAIRIAEESSWFSSEQNLAMKPGDTVVVPLDSDYASNIELWTSATQIFYNSAIAIAAINGL